MEAITLFGVELLPHTWPLVFGLGGLWVFSAAFLTGFALWQVLSNFLKLIK